MPATPNWPPRSAPRLFVEQLLENGAIVSLDGNMAHYLSKVMRATVNDIVILCDNQTGEWVGTVTNVTKRSVDLEIGECLRIREEAPDFWLCPALLKKDRFAMVLEKVTELGVRRIAPIITARCVADKINEQRAKAIINEAAEQCARTALPEFDLPVKITKLLENLPDNRTLFFADELGGENAASAFAQTSGPAALVTGPEGGFDDAERALLLQHPNVKRISLGPRILRGETAAIAAISLWMGTVGDW